MVLCGIFICVVSDIWRVMTVCSVCCIVYSVCVWFV